MNSVHRDLAKVDLVGLRWRKTSELHRAQEVYARKVAKLIVQHVEYQMRFQLTTASVENVRELACVEIDKWMRKYQVDVEHMDLCSKLVVDKLLGLKAQETEAQVPRLATDKVRLPSLEELFGVKKVAETVHKPVMVPPTRCKQMPVVVKEFKALQGGA